MPTEDGAECSGVSLTVCVCFVWGTSMNMYHNMVIYGGQMPLRPKQSDTPYYMQQLTQVYLDDIGFGVYS